MIWNTPKTFENFLLQKMFIYINIIYIYIYIFNKYIYIYIYIISRTNSPLLNPAIQRMGNTPNILSPRCREQDKSQPHFILYCKLSKITLGYISELINLNYFFTIPFKFSLKTIIMGFFPILWWCTFKNSTHTFRNYSYASL